MTELSGVSGKIVRTGKAGSAKAPTVSYGVFKPVIQSAVGIVRESVGLVLNVASLGVALISENTAVHPTPRAAHKAQVRARHGNIIPFPTSRKRNSN